MSQFVLLDQRLGVDQFQSKEAVFKMCMQNIDFAEVNWELARDLGPIFEKSGYLFPDLDPWTWDTMYNSKKCLTFVMHYCKLNYNIDFFSMAEIPEIFSASDLEDSMENDTGYLSQ